MATVKKNASASAVSTASPTAPTTRKNAAKSKSEADDELTMLLIRIPVRVHTKLKKHCADRRIPIREYILELLRLEGIR